MQVFEGARPAQFIERPNRFVVHAELDGAQVRAYLANPGRLSELLFKGDDFSYTVVGVVPY